MDIVLKVTYNFLRTAFPKILTNVLVLLADRRHSGGVKETISVTKPKFRSSVFYGYYTVHRQPSVSV
jgi:hypothetical protein